MLFACIASFVIFCVPQDAFALDKYYDQMQRNDYVKLHKMCDRMKAKESGVAVFSAPDQYVEVTNEMKAKYPNLEFVNPCEF